MEEIKTGVSYLWTEKGRRGLGIFIDNQLPKDSTFGGSYIELNIVLVFIAISFTWVRKWVIKKKSL